LAFKSRLTLVARLGSALAIGLFRYLKRELGDDSHEELVSGLHDVTHRARDGYHRGRDAADRAQKRCNNWTNRQRIRKLVPPGRRDRR
jgi:hypothetical protein